MRREQACPRSPHLPTDGWEPNRGAWGVSYSLEGPYFASSIVRTKLP